MSRRRGLWLSLGAVALLLLVGRALAGVYAERRWYDALGAFDMWSLRAQSVALLRTTAFVIAAGFAFANLWGVRHSVVSLVWPRRLGNIEIGEEVPPAALLVLALTLSLAVGVVFALPASDWQAFDLARYGIAFNEADPYVNADVGFYVYRLPFERSVYAWCVGLVAALCVVVVGLYALTPSLRWSAGRLHISTYVRRHISLLGGVTIALLAWGFRLDAYAPFTHGSGPDGAFSAMDHQLGSPISLILAYAAISAAFVVAWAGWTGQSRIALAVMTVLLLLTPTMQYALPLIVRLGSAPVDPAVRERAYLRDRSGYTRRAFGVDRIGSAGPGETFESIRDAASVSVWDPLILTRAIEHMRRGGRIVGSPSLTTSPTGPVFVSIEESAPVRDDPGSGGWNVVRSLASVTDERGSLVRVDAQGRYPLDDQRVGPVLVYEGAVDMALVVDTGHVVAAPSMESFAARLTEAWSRQDFRLLAAPSRGARIVRRRDVRDRVRALAPFFLQSSRVIPVVHADSLIWTLELYAATEDYPLSRKFMVGDANVAYMHHAATALVSARSGSVMLVADADPDPITATWMRLLPRTFVRATMLAPSLAALLPPDVDGAEVQGRAFAAVGARLEAATSRRLPSLDGSDTAVRTHTPTFVWLPGAEVSAWIAPVVDNADRVTGVLLATGGASRALRWIPLRDTSIVWGALLDRLQRAASGSSDERLREPRVAGRVRLLPLTDGRVLALQPFYGWPSDGTPYVSQVALAIGDSTRTATSVAAVVGAPVRAGPEPATADARAERMRALYAEMRIALEKGDWKRFGAAFDALGALLQQRR